MVLALRRSWNSLDCFLLIIRSWGWGETWQKCLKGRQSDEPWHQRIESCRYCVTMNEQSSAPIDWTFMGEYLSMYASYKCVRAKEWEASVSFTVVIASTRWPLSDWKVMHPIMPYLGGTTGIVWHLKVHYLYLNMCTSFIQHCIQVLCACSDIVTMLSALTAFRKIGKRTS